jgi:putative DNA methylase
MNYPKRLIEVDLPIKRISAHARREKSIRHGHISTLHIWWARRPLAACRAVICASLWPDPVDVTEAGMAKAKQQGRDLQLNTCPPSFRAKAKELMRDWATRHLGLVSAESFPRFNAIAQDPDRLNDYVELRKALLDFIADFANWDNSTVREYLDTSRALTQAAHEALGGAPGTRPLVVDPFAGGGSIPLEALRVGADAFASDLNPVAVLLNKVVTQYIPQYGQRLAAEVRKWGNQIQDEVAAELAKYYPISLEGDVPVAYLWARTVISEAPSSDAVPVEVPLLRSMWLAKASSQDRAFRWKRDSAGNIATELAEVSYADETQRTVRRPILEIFAPTKSAEVGPGTVARGSATCPITGFTTPVSSIRKQLKSRAGGASDARLLAIRQSNPKTNDRSYRAPTLNDETAADAAKRKIKANAAATDGKRSLLPNEPLPPAGGLGFRVQPYGMVQWKQLFAPRQQLALVTLTRSINRVGVQLAQTGDRHFAVAVQSCLALALGRLTDFCSSLCTLNATGNRGVFHTFARQALPMVWDFMETVPLNRIGANWIGGIETLDDTIRLQSVVGHSGQVQMASAANHPLPDDIASAVVTDPPYYDAVPYSDLSDYFYVWLKRTLPSEHEFDSELTPKPEECIVDEAKGKDRAFFESKMAKAMGESRRFLRPDGISLVVFAHKSTSGWEAQLQAMVDAGWIITGSWPIDTERPGRLRAQGSAALQSSVHLVCRPRKDSDGSAGTDEIGDWRDVLQELPRRIHEWMPRLAAEGVVGADAIFACLGPALEIFSRYSHVEKASGEAVTLKEYLEQVWAAVAKEALTMVFAGADATGFEEDARLTAMWLWTLSPGPQSTNGSVKDEKDEGTEEEATNDENEESAKAAKASGFVLEYDAARKIAQGLGAHLEELSSLIEVKGNKARLLPVAERSKYLFGKGETDAPAKINKKRAQPKLFEELEESLDDRKGWGAKGGPAPGDTTLDRIHQSMILFAAGRSEALRRFLVEDGAGTDERFWRLANALSALYPVNGDEKRWVDGVLARKKGLGF